MSKQAITLLSLLILLSSPADARDDRLKFPLQDALTTEAAREKLDQGVAFYFGDQQPDRALEKRFGEYGSNKKTNAFNKSDKQACEWVFLSALLSLRDRALQEGGNAVINIRSNYKSVEFSSSTEYECGAGAIIAGVALKGDVVKLK